MEAASGKRLDAYLRDNLFAPLGMSDTAFKITDGMRKRLVGMHARGEDGQLASIPIELVRGSVLGADATSARTP